MHYVLSDIHGCCEEYLELLEKISFGEEDILYVLGDVCDKGPCPVRVLQDMMRRKGIRPVMGNHDLAALRSLRKLGDAVTREDYRSVLRKKDRLDFAYWYKDGGYTTFDEFRELPAAEREKILAYLDSFSFWEKVSVGAKTYVLVHAGIRGYKEGMALENISPADFLFYRTNYDRPVFRDPSVILVTGHTPTFLVRPDRQSLVYETEGHLGIDCGCVYGGRLAAVCLETGRIFYADAHRTSL